MYCTPQCTLLVTLFIISKCQKNLLHVTAKQEGIGGSYRLASLDRLANRQRVLEQNNGLGQADMMKNGNGTSATESSVNGNGGGFTVGVRKIIKESC
jgi:hypothetical protein